MRSFPYIPLLLKTPAGCRLYILENIFASSGCPNPYFLQPDIVSHIAQSGTLLLLIAHELNNPRKGKSPLQDGRL